MSRPVGGILSGSLRTVGGHPSKRPTRGLPLAGRWATMSPAWPCSRWGLPSEPGRPGPWCALTAPFHPCLCPRIRAIGGLFSVALSFESPRLAVSQHRCPAESRPSSTSQSGIPGVDAAATWPTHRGLSLPARRLRRRGGLQAEVSELRVPAGGPLHRVAPAFAVDGKFWFDHRSGRPGVGHLLPTRPLAQRSPG